MRLRLTMNGAVSLSALSFLLLAGTTLADPVPASCNVFCFRITDIRADKNDTELNKFHFEFEVLNWADAFAGGLQLDLAQFSSPGVRFSADTFFNFNGVDANGRPLQLEDTNNDMVIDANDMEDTNSNGILDPGEDQNANNRLDNDPIPGNLNNNNNWILKTQTNTKMEWELGTAIPYINLLEADNQSNQGCAQCITSLASLARTPPPPVTVDPVTGNVNPVEAVDNGDNVQDGFVMTIDGLDVGKAVHINWFLKGAGGAQVGLEAVTGMPNVCRQSRPGGPDVPIDQPIGVVGQGNAYGFGLISLFRVDNGALPGPVFVGNTGARQTGTEFFDSVYIVPDPAIFAMEFGAGLTAPFENPDDNTLNATVNAELITEDCPLVAGCCEEDCCGPGTSFDGLTCVEDPSASGFDGTYSPNYEFGCVFRLCCEDDCCGEGTAFDQDILCCIGGS